MNVCVHPGADEFSENGQERLSNKNSRADILVVEGWICAM
jgi:hypothetical protein